MAVEVSTSLSPWLDSSGIWLFCIDKNVYTIQMRDFPSINVKFDKDTVSGMLSIGRESWAVLVRSFANVPVGTFQGRPDHSNAIDLPGMPVHNLDQAQQCSCFSGGSIFVQDKDNAISTTELTESGSESDQDDGQGNSDQNSDYDEHYTSIIQIRGSTNGEHFQQNLKDVQGALRQCLSVPVRLLLEEDNHKDKNSISVNVTVNSKDLKLGYIGVNKISKLAKAMTSGEIVKTSMKSVTSWYVRNLNSRKLKGSIVICKKGKWLPDSDNNVYNADL